MDDRRVFARLPVEFPLRFLNLWEGKEGQATTFDISVKGIGMYTNQELQLHTGLEMWLKIPDKSESLYTRGEVSWLKKVPSNNYRVGINLEKADLMDVLRLRTS